MIGPAGRKPVAIKQLAGDAALETDARRRLIDEARLVFQLRHVNVCQVLDLASSEEGTFVVMEYVEGLDLRALVRRAGPMPIPLALYVGREVARALDYAHRRRDDGGQPLFLVHGDVTPGNVLLSAEGEVKLADFGIARALGGAAPGRAVRGGTPGFMAPEVEAGATPTLRADIYGLGMSLYHALTGKRQGDAGFAPRALRSARPDASPELEALLARAVAGDPAERFASAGQLEEALAIELARRHAAFTPSALARFVSEHRDATATDPIPTSATVLESMTGWTSPEPTTPHPAGGGTETLEPEERRRRRMPILLLSAGLVLGGTAAVIAWVVPALRKEATAPVAQRSAAPPVAAAPAVPPDGGTAVDDEEDAAPAPARPPHRRPSSARATPAAARAAPESEPGHLTVTAATWGAVYVDGKQVAPQTPLYRYALPAGRHTVKLFQPSNGRYSRERPVEVKAGQLATVTFP
jgi:serine/threonine-protein kinase